MTFTRLAITSFLLALFSTIASAEPSTFYDNIVEEPVNEVWLNPGLSSYHFQEDRNLNNNNYGFGAEYRYSTTKSVTAGRFYNSEYQTSSYAAWLWQPVMLGPVRFGALLGVINGYPRANNGNWFPLVLPVASYEYKFIGINLTYVPTIQDTVYGALSLQLKLKVY
jgi:hypothetical protein